MNSIIKRIKAKILLWVRFYKMSSNFWQVAWFRVITMLHLDAIFPYDARINLQDGTSIYYGPKMDLSAVPVVVEIWDEQMYTPKNYQIGAHDIVFDLGANVGNFAMYAANRTDGIVYAFEPVPKNFDLLQQNIHHNQLANVMPVKAAVTDRKGTATIHVSDVDTAHSVTHKAFSQAGDIEVQTVDLESFCNEKNVDRIHFLKIDCEGAEYDIIAQMTDAMLSRIDTIAMEHHERFVGRDHKEISDRLVATGFRILELPPHFIFASKVF